MTDITTIPTDTLEVDLRSCERESPRSEAASAERL
jgi:hypothetical protein